MDPAATHAILPFTIEPRTLDACERFIVIGDMGTGGVGQRAVAASMAIRAKQQPVDFVLSVGDNIYPNGVVSADDPQWDSKFEAVYVASSLQVPFYAVLGNHDHRGSVWAQINRSEHSDRWTMPARHYTFMRTLADGTKVQFFALDTLPIAYIETDPTEQLAWLDAQLEQSDARWKIVFGHHPLYGHNPERGHNARMIARLEPLFARHRVDLYLAGHDHTLEMIKPVDGVHYVISGTAAGKDNAYQVDWTPESYYVATGGGFVLCRVTRDRILIEFVRTSGQTQYAHTLTK